MIRLFLQILNMSIIGSILIGIIIPTRHLFNRAPRWVLNIMWALIAFSLIIPIRFETKLNPLPAKMYDFGINAGDRKTDITRKQFDISFERREDIAQTYLYRQPQVKANHYRVGLVKEPNLNHVDMAHNNTGYAEVLSYIWFAGIIIFLIYYIAEYWIVKRQVSASIYSADNVFICDDIKTPFVLGIIYPRIYLPSFIEGRTRADVLEHERSHIAHLDHIWKQFALLLLALHWFNPIAWLAFNMYCSDIELACDERVIRNLSLEDKKGYAESLLKCSISNHVRYTYSLSFGEVSVKTRIKHILSNKKPQVVISALVIGICMLLAACSFTRPVRTKAAAERLEKTEDNSNTENVTTENTEEQDMSAENGILEDDNIYYNGYVKICMNKVFVCVDGDIYVKEENDSEFKKIASGNYMLGVVDDNGIYLCEYTGDDNNSSYGIAYINAADYSVTKLESDIDLANADGVAAFLGMYINGTKLFVEGTEKVNSYLINEDGSLSFISSDEAHSCFFYSEIFDAGLKYANIENRDENLSGNLQLELQNGNEQIIENVTDVMLTRYGALARNNSMGNKGYKDIYCYDYDTGEASLVYDSKNQGNLLAQYCTYDKNGFYCLQSEGNGRYNIIQCSWGGDCKTIYSFEYDDLIIANKMHIGIIGGWLYFYDFSDNQMKCINIADNTLVKIA